MRARGDGGETLIEVLFTIVIVSLTFSALFTALATAGNGGNVQRTSVQSDVVLRNYAEATKAAALDCVYPGTYTVVYPATLPAGFAISVTGIGSAAVGLPSSCPVASSPQTLTLKVTGPLSFKATMDNRVRTP